MKLLKNLQLTAVIVSIPWLVYIIDFATPVDLRLYGLRPRQLEGLWGIVFSPFLHGNLNHLIANTGVLFVLLLVSLSILKTLVHEVESINQSTTGDPQLVAAARKRALLVVGVALKLTDPEFKIEDSDTDKLADIEVEKIAAAQAVELPTWLGEPEICENIFAEILKGTINALNPKFRTDGFSKLIPKGDDVCRYKIEMKG